MGDRALVIFKSKAEVSPVAYLHWGGEEVPGLLKRHKTLMTGDAKGDKRWGDVEYAFARFLGICHAENPTSNLSLGAWNIPEKIRDAVLVAGDEIADQNARAAARSEITEYSHGDAGVIVVDVDTYEWRAYGGYLADKPKLAVNG